MALKLSKTLSAVLISITLCHASYGDMLDELPDMGTTAGATLSINQELAMGDFYVRQLRAGTPLIYDPLLNVYINKLGQSLVAHADSVKTPFEFYLVRNNEINAFAFFGGNVVLHSALFRESDNESQLASVMSHEIAHVTQRHLARSIEEQNRNAPLTWVGAFGSVLLAMANPQAGMAALSTTLASAQQNVISFTQANEQEADRIGIRTLSQAGFESQAMPAFMQKLADQYRYASKPPEMLLTHPLPDSRLTDSRNRAEQMPKKHIPSSLDYWLAKVRIAVMYDTSNAAPAIRQNLLNQLQAGDSKQQLAANYGKALQFYQNRQFADATKQLQPLLAQQPDNVWFLDLITDIDLEQGQAQQAIKRLEKALTAQSNNQIIQINLANAYIEAKQFEKGYALLNRYTFNNPSDMNGWELLSKVAAERGLRDEELAARAERLALTAQLDQAIELLISASNLAKNGSLQQARYDARIDQLRQLQKRFNQYQR